MLGFETLTLAPIDRRLVVKAMMSPQEIAQLDAYHARVPVGGDRPAGSGRRSRLGWCCLRAALTRPPYA